MPEKMVENIKVDQIKYKTIKQTSGASDYKQIKSAQTHLAISVTSRFNFAYISCISTVNYSIQHYTHFKIHFRKYQIPENSKATVKSFISKKLHCSNKPQSGTHIVPKIFSVFFFQNLKDLRFVSHLEVFPLSQCGVIYCSFPNQLTPVALFLIPFHSIQQEVLVKLNCPCSAFSCYHYYLTMIFLWLNHKPIQGQLLCIHIHLEQVRTIIKFSYFEYNSPTFFCTVPFKFSEVFLFSLLFGEFTGLVGLYMFAKSLLLLFFCFFLNFTRVQNKLILHDKGHIRDSQLRFFRFYQTQSNHIIFFLQLFFLSLSLKFFSLVLGQIDWYNHVIFFKIFISYFLLTYLVIYLCYFKVLFDLKFVQCLFKSFTLRLYFFFLQNLGILDIGAKQDLIPPFNLGYSSIILQSRTTSLSNNLSSCILIFALKNVRKMLQFFFLYFIIQSRYRLIGTFLQELQTQSRPSNAFFVTNDSKIPIKQIF